MRHIFFVTLVSFFCFTSRATDNVVVDNLTDLEPKPQFTIFLTQNNRTQEIKVMHELYADVKPELNEFIKICDETLTPQELAALINMLHTSFAFSYWDSELRTCGPQLLHGAFQVYQEIQSPPEEKTESNTLANAAIAIAKIIVMRHKLYTTWQAHNQYVQEQAGNALQSIIAQLQNNIKNRITRHLDTHQPVVKKVLNENHSLLHQTGQAMLQASQVYKELSENNLPIDAPVEDLSVKILDTANNVGQAVYQECEKTIQQTTKITELANGLQTLASPLFLTYYAALFDHLHEKGFTPIEQMLVTEETAENKKIYLPAAHIAFTE